jgi:hypothetical protein
MRTSILILAVLLLAFQQAVNRVDNNGHKQGKFITYYPNGKVKDIRHYINDTIHGHAVWFYDDGFPHIEKTFVMGREIDTVKMYLKGGRLDQLFVYTDSFECWYLLNADHTILQQYKHLRVPPYGVAK